ncbi:MAG: hypothetical protein RBG13Loki_4107 [Promethearchaeota archaeon CR_4]|nr:MAG: hypothetical protein RBG13Loki_4107 [Candidatus Lokiarchaeota archaeon CR_4]
MKDTNPTYKLILFGDGGVGKTSLAHRYLTGVFNEGIGVTIGVEFYIKNIMIGGKSIKLQVWDFGGEQRFRFLLPSYCKKSDGGLFLYDITNLSTLHSLKQWMEVISVNAPNIPILVVGTKTDLVEKRKVTKEEAVQVSKNHKMSGFVEVSAKTGFNVENVFETILKIMMSKTL